MAILLNSQQDARHTRRHFLGSAAALAAAPFMRALGANSDVRIGIVGLGSKVDTGGMGKNDMRRFRKVPGVRIAALCDVDRTILEEEQQKCRDLHETVAAYSDLRKLLDDKTVDAIVVTTPNHWHALATIWACQAGKDVYCQKPASHNIFEGRRMVEAARKYKRIVAVPQGNRGSQKLAQAWEYARQGKLGKVLYTHAILYNPRRSLGRVAAPTPVPAGLDYDLWCGPAPVLPLMREHLHYHWHWFWPYGSGEMGNNGVHRLDDCRSALGQRSLPERVLSVGARLGYDDGGETPNTQIAFFDYKPAPVVLEIRGLPRSLWFREHLFGGNNEFSMDSYMGVRNGLVLHCEGGFIAGSAAYDKRGRLVQEFSGDARSPHANFIEAVRSRKAETLMSDVLDGHLSFSEIRICLIKCELPIRHRSSPSVVFTAFFAFLRASLRRRAALQIEILALRHQLGVLQRSVKRPKLTAADRFLWAWLSRVWVDWRSALVIVNPQTVISWHRKGFRLFWTWKVRHGQPGRPTVPKEVRDLIRKMSRENPLWGAPRIHGELLKLGIDIGETSVSKYLVRHRKPPSQTWRTFLENHIKTMVSIDFFTVPTIRFQVLYVFLVLAHERRRILHFGVTAHPTAAWTAQQLRDAFPWDTAPRYLLRDRDRIFGDDFRKQVKAMGIKEVLAAPRSPWQRAYVERVIGTIRRECLDHVMVFNEASLHRHVKLFISYYHESRTHLSLAKDAPETRPVQAAEAGGIVAIPQVGGLHHRYERRAA